LPSASIAPAVVNALARLTGKPFDALRAMTRRQNVGPA
jgi:hypothetical protein